MKEGDVVEFTKAVSGRLIGRVCHRHANTLWWVNFPAPFGCMPVDEVDLRPAEGNPPGCSGCPN